MIWGTANGTRAMTPTPDLPLRQGPATYEDMRRLLVLVVDRLAERMGTSRPQLGYMTVALKLIRDQSVSITLSDADKTRLEGMWSPLLETLHERLLSGKASSRELALAFQALEYAEQALLKPKELTPEDMAEIFKRMPFKPSL